MNKVCRVIRVTVLQDELFHFVAVLVDLTTGKTHTNVAPGDAGRNLAYFELDDHWIFHVRISQNTPYVGASYTDADGMRYSWCNQLPGEREIPWGTQTTVAVEITTEDFEE